MPYGKFITLEGGEGAGKSTQAKRLATFLRKRGRKVVLTREVGGSKSAEEIRALWLGKGEGHWDPLTETLLIFAARREHLVKKIWPALKRGEWVISDRFADSTRAYQGAGLGLDDDFIENLYHSVAGNFEPDLTLLLDLPIAVGLSRMKKRGGQNDRYQRKKTAFHKKLRKAYLALAKKYPRRLMIINASRDTSCVTLDIEAVVTKRLLKR